MVGTGIGLILSFLVVAGGFAPLVQLSAGNAPDLTAQSTSAPFGAGEVTTPDLSPERFAAALPEQFGGAEREYLGFVPVEEQVHGFSTTSEEFLYYDPATVTDVWVIINDLGSEPTVRSAVESVAVGIDAELEFEVEEQSTTSAAAVPFLLANQNQSLYAFVWGARGGDWIFSVFTTSESARDEFVRILVDNLQMSSPTQSQVTGRTPSASSQPSNVPQSSGGSEAGPNEIAELLLTSPFPDSELPVGFAGAEVSGRERRPDGEGISVSVGVSFPPDTVQSIDYAIYPTALEAERAWITHSNFLQSDLGMTAYNINDTGLYPTLLHTSGIVYEYVGVHSVCTILIGKVYVIGSSVGETSGILANEYACLFAGVGVTHLRSLGYAPDPAPSENTEVGASSQQGGELTSEPDGTASHSGVTFTPQQLDVQLGDTVTVEVAMPTSDFGGLYDLNLLIPPQFQLASDPMCISNAESCVNFEPDVIPQLDGSIAIVISGYYGLSEPGQFTLELDVVDVPQAGGPSVGISAQLVFYTRHVEHDPVDTWLEVNFE